MAKRKNKNEDQSLKNGLTGTFKKIISTSSAGEISKELINTALSQVSKTKEDVSTLVVNEVMNMINKIDFVKEFSKFAEDHKFKITAEVEITKKNKK